MPDIIKLLPDSVANQIAAGEVVQRPASVVKELLENAVDAGATEVVLRIKDAGRSSVQVIDNGNGMTESDARMAFERHATSKIRSAEDLFAIKSFGFRGEALASIASVAQVELKTRMADTEMGSHILIEGSRFISQEVCSCQTGTSILVKNLFFNIPARRNFLKSNQIEGKHIYDEFFRVALTHPEIRFQLYENDKVMITADKGNLHQRIVSLFGKHFNQRLITVEQETEYVNVKGFIVKPEYARKQRGEQYFFVNQRFIRSFFLNAAVQRAFSELIPEGSFAGYFLFIDLNPSELDINIHPTKTEIKFQDERMISAILASSVKRALGVNNAMPSIDFENEPAFDVPFHPDRQIVMPSIKINPDYNPFNKTVSLGKNASIESQHRWEPEQSRLYSQPTELDNAFGLDDDKMPLVIESYIQLDRKFIVSTLKSGLLVVNQHLAHFRIMFDKLMNQALNRSTVKQKLMFTETLSLNPAESAALEKMLPELLQIGFEINQLADGSFELTAVPVDWSTSDVSFRLFIEEVIAAYFNGNQVSKTVSESAILTMARKLSVREGQILTNEMMCTLIAELFASSSPEWAPDGLRIFAVIPPVELDNWINKI